MRFGIPERALRRFYDTALAFYGKRQGVRPVAMSVMCSVVEGSYAADPDAPAPTTCRAFDITFRRAAWKDPTPPQIGEWILYRCAAEDMWLKADSVAYMPDGDYCISASWEPKRRPSWSV